MNRKFALRDPLAVIRSLMSDRPLIVQFIRREVVGRYKGSFLGLFWSFITPLVMLAIYTFVFGFIFKSRWRPTSTDHAEFAIVMFVGVLVHGLMAECLNRAPTLVVGNPNYVKKVVFPLQALGWISVGTALFHMLIASSILLVAVFLWQGHLPLTAVLAPVVLLPFLILTVGLVWILSSLGVFMRDLGQVMGIVTSLLMFLAPVFYPITSVPKTFQVAIMFNPLTFVIEQLRGVVIWGHGIDWAGWCIYSLIAYAVAWGGLIWFEKTRKGFADVL
ncbi:sugar ABC transporter permease [Burkholderia stagnalis]|uniref:Transport permease protein n=1 Tax=Burkholderia stagnalis TaxID=1503054 RepID=A0A6L3N019_9BURK|nr:ABC transporter permease [Burkholderia stagnalis]KAB0638876.1 ABC transporter permease [Burkholderia stagnalis]KVN31128.1 sugar ABC transporter permease [Burkholderia stagnalis]KVN61654.1 sugar ABC transporter permease [Burkholderia stagnalis]KVO38231.1 sugar ABC transporter permease [Burkholderia stagnalis]KVO73101.1 sugar ABC transporter permease [Burkholderia stagnalis]